MRWVIFHVGEHRWNNRLPADTMSTVERAIAIAAEGHAGQLDKAGNPYVLHPLRVMLRLDTPEERMAGVLHDVVEDCGWSIDDLRAEGFSEAVLRAVEAVTKRDGETYDEFVARAAADPIGRRVKLADLEDNCDLRRIHHPTEKDFARIEKYRRAIAMIREIDKNEKPRADLQRFDGNSIEEIVKKAAVAFGVAPYQVSYCVEAKLWGSFGEAYIAHAEPKSLPVAPLAWAWDVDGVRHVCRIYPGDYDAQIHIFEDGHAADPNYRNLSPDAFLRASVDDMPEWVRREADAVAAAVLRWNRKEVVDHVLARPDLPLRGVPGCPCCRGFLDPRDEPDLQVLDDRRTWVWERSQSKEYEDLVRCRMCGSKWRVVYSQSADGVRSEHKIYALPRDYPERWPARS
jgi:hypothetical protein